MTNTRAGTQNALYLSTQDPLGVIVEYLILSTQEPLGVIEDADSCEIITPVLACRLPYTNLPRTPWV